MYDWEIKKMLYFLSMQHLKKKKKKHFCFECNTMLSDLVPLFEDIWTQRKEGKGIPITIYN